MDRGHVQDAVLGDAPEDLESTSLLAPIHPIDADEFQTIGAPVERVRVQGLHTA